MPPDTSLAATASLLVVSNQMKQVFSAAVPELMDRAVVNSCLVPPSAATG